MLTCPNCLSHVDGNDEGEGYTCPSCCAFFDRAALVSPEMRAFWEEAAKERDYDVERVKAEVAEKLAAEVEPTTTPTYGSGEIWHAFHYWEKLTEQ